MLIGRAVLLSGWVDIHQLIQGRITCKPADNLDAVRRT